jgi:hypothetical protein
MTARRKPRSSTFSRADRQPGFAFKTFIVSGGGVDFIFEAHGDRTVIMKRVHVRRS